jgi:hypothetical protein
VNTRYELISHEISLQTDSILTNKDQITNEKDGVSTTDATVQPTKFALIGVTAVCLQDARLVVLC